jgi:hypothetical protein
MLLGRQRLKERQKQVLRFTTDDTFVEMTRLFAEDDGIQGQA